MPLLLQVLAKLAPRQAMEYQKVPTNAQIVYTRQGISPMLFLPEVLGTETAIKVGRYSGLICLPILGEAYSEGFRRVCAPSNYYVGGLASVHNSPGLAGWGHQLELPSGATEVRAFLIEFELAKTKPAARKQITKLESLLDPWFGLVREWVEVTTGQDLSVAEPLGGTATSLNHLWAWRSGSTWRKTTAASITINAGRPDVSMAITLQNWQNAIRNANQGKRPPEPHLLLRDARARFNRGQYSYSAIFSGISVEIVIKHRIEDELRSRRNPQLFIDQLLNNTLGRLLRICKALSIATPTNVERDVVEPRNRAVHRNAVVTKDEAKKSLDLAGQMINDRFPL